jgi:hypothetical protein
METTCRGSFWMSRRGNTDDGGSGGKSDAEALSLMLLKAGVFGVGSPIGDVAYQ